MKIGATRKGSQRIELGALRLNLNTIKIGQ